MLTLSKVCDLFNEEFNPKTHKADYYSGYSNSPSTWTMASFFETHLLTEEVCAKFVAAHMSPKIEIVNDSTSKGVYITVEMLPSHPLYDEVVSMNSRHAKATMFTIHRKKYDGTMYFCDCRYTEVFSAKDGSREADPYELWASYLNKIYLNTVGNAYEKIRIVDEALKRIGDDEMAKNFFIIMHQIATYKFPLSISTSKSYWQGTWGDECCVFNPELRARLISHAPEAKPKE